MRRVKVFQFQTYDPGQRAWLPSPLYATWEWICAFRAMAIEDSGRYVDSRDIANGICVEAGPPALESVVPYETRNTSTRAGEPPRAGAAT